jgi:hypothetical protein
MRNSITARRSRLLALAATALAVGFGAAAATVPAAQAVGPPAVNTITITSPLPPPATTAMATTGQAQSFAIPVTETDQTQTLAVTAAGTPPLPAGIGISDNPAAAGNATVHLTGTFAAPYTGTITLNATDGTANAAPVTFTLKAANKITVTAPAKETSTIGVALAAPVTIAATDTDTSATVSFSDGGTLPAGLSIDPATGAITGTPTTAGSSQVAITATDGLGATTNTVFPWTVYNVITVLTPNTETSMANTPISPVTPTVADSTKADGTYTFSALDLPPGLGINPTTGVISGTPTKAGTYATVITVTDSVGSQGTADVAWKVGKQNTINLTTNAPKPVIKNGVAVSVIYHGVAITVKVVATDSAKTQKITKWTVGKLPPGLAATASGNTLVIAGRPARDALFETAITATDGTGATGTITIPFDVTNAVGVIDLQPALKTTTVGAGTVKRFGTTDAIKGERIVRVTATGLPPGMALSQHPLMIYGWPTKAGKYLVSIEAFGSLGSTDAKRNDPLTVNPAPAKGTTGQFRLTLDGKCLQAPKGAKVEIANCVSGGTERWTIPSDGTIRIGGHCLDISGSSSYSGKAVQLAACTASARELWAQGPRNELVNPTSGLCLSDKGASRNNGVVPVMGGCTGQPDQQWLLPGRQVQTLLGGCLDDLHSVGVNGAVVDKYSCNGTVAQAWTFEPDGTIHVGQYPGDCLTAHVGKITLYACAKGSKAQQWTVVRETGLGSELMQNGLCVSMPKLTAGDGTQLVAAKCGGTSPLDLWHIW